MAAGSGLQSEVDFYKNTHELHGIVHVFRFVWCLEMGIEFCCRKKSRFSRRLASSKVEQVAARASLFVFVRHSRPNMELICSRDFLLTGPDFVVKKECSTVFH